MHKPNPLLLLELRATEHLFSICQQLLPEHMLIRLCQRSLRDGVNVPEILSFLSTVPRDKWDWVEPTIIALQETKWHPEARAFIGQF